MQAKRYLPWELFWQITPEGSTQILGAVWVRRERKFMLWNGYFFFKGDKTGESNWTEAQYGLWVASHEPAAHFPCWKKGRSVSLRSLTEKGSSRQQQLVSQPQAGFWGTWQTLTQLLGAPAEELWTSALIKTKNQSAGTSWSKVCEKSQMTGKPWGLAASQQRRCWAGGLAEDKEDASCWWSSASSCV